MKALPEVKKESLFKRCGRALAHGAPPRHAEAGQALVEFALLAPVLVLIFLGTVEFGRLCYIVIEASSAARAAAEYGSQSPITAGDNAGMLQAAQQDAPEVPGLTTTSSTSSCATAYSSNCTGPVCQCSTPPPVPGVYYTNCTTTYTSACTGRLLVFVQVNTSAQYTPTVSLPGQSSSISVTGQAIMPVGQ
jgi:Flp pilus assembly protein TadG